jgi:glycogen synthase
MKVLFVASEAVPFVKTGGLGDVVGELPKFLGQKDIEVSIVLPKYKSIDNKYVKDFEFLKYFYVDINQAKKYVGVFKYKKDNLNYYFIDNEEYFRREQIYGYDDDYLRYGFFNVAIIRMIKELGLKFDIIQLHDWEAGMVAPLIKENNKDVEHFKDTKIIMTLNGIDYHIYNPKKDEMIVRNYEKYDAVRLENKEYLQKKFNLEVNQNIPLFIMVTRLTFQKGIELVLKNIDYMMSKNTQLIVLGSGEQQYIQELERYRTKYPNNIGIFIGYNDELAHQIYAGGDMFLMPSLFEPCGVGQLIALRYGAVPLVRNCGGLKDTVINYSADDKKGVGFVFNDYDEYGLKYAINVSLEHFSHPVIWRRIVKNAMSIDYSWYSSANKYYDLYNQLLGQK